ncbi:unnamed protein product [Moneuplotes crassus]|uniref:PPM-type phosphatase domain-containing protein n=2 Tax=Euplotes crassus TaxID=5936 RepID=A0AAD2DAR2_EUPCR|nr:unnamed protein product [Moneuplotes crassus]
MRSIDVNDRAIKDAFKSYQYSLSRSKKNFFYKRGNSNDSKVVNSKYGGHFTKYRTRQNSPNRPIKPRENIHDNLHNFQMFHKVSERKLQVPKRRIETGKINFVLGKKKPKRFVGESQATGDSTYWTTSHTKSLTRENFKKKNSPKSSWSTPFAKKINLKSSAIDDIFKSENSQKRETEGPSSYKAKRFNATHHMEKRRTEKSTTEESKDRVPVAAVPEIKPFKGAVIDPNNIVQEYQEKESIKICSVFEKSRTGFIPIGPETGFQAKTNQDAYMTVKSFCGVPGQYFLGVFDGHGYNGHKVSKYIKKKLPKNIRSKVSDQTHSYIDKVKQGKGNGGRIIQAFNSRRSSAPNTSEETQELGNIFDSVGKEGAEKRGIIEQSFYHTHSDLKKQKFDIEFSGTTAVACIISPNGVLTCANIGDSRAILLSESKGEWSFTALSRDHKPEDPSEYERILKYGGRVEAYKDEFGEDYGPKRVWLKSENLPGLAMSRSFGDLCACRAGVVQSPEFREHKLTKEDRAIVLASDGVWEFLSNKDVMNILIPYLESNKEVEGINEVVKKSVAHWKKEDTVIDDITIVLAKISSGSRKEMKTFHTSSHVKSQHDLKLGPNFYNLHS